MKTTRLLTIVAGLFLVASCSKSHNCVCTTTNSDGEEVGSSNTVIEGKRSDAKAECEAGSGSLFGVTTECKLDGLW